jgi:hypothetical protein
VIIGVAERLRAMWQHGWLAHAEFAARHRRRSPR